MNKLTVDERVQEIIAYAKGQGLEGIELFDRIEALGHYLDDSSKGNEIPANRRPRAETRARLMLIGTGLIDYGRTNAGYSDDVERTAQYKQKLDEAELPKVER